MLNKVILMGRFARDPECKYIGDRKVANFTLAVDRGRKNANGEREADSSTALRGAARPSSCRNGLPRA